MNIKSVREGARMTQQELATALGINRSTVAMWETGQSHPRAQKLQELARVFGCTVDELLAGPETEQ